MDPTTTVQVDVVIDDRGRAYRAYLTASREQKVVVVRPDGVVGATVRVLGGYRNTLTRFLPRTYWMSRCISCNDTPTT